MISKLFMFLVVLLLLFVLTSHIAIVEAVQERDFPRDTIAAPVTIGIAIFVFALIGGL